jgi:hypothetical protein
MTSRSAGYRTPLATSVGLALSAVLVCGCLGPPLPDHAIPFDTVADAASTSSSSASSPPATSPSAHPSASAAGRAPPDLRRMAGPEGAPTRGSVGPDRGTQLRRGDVQRRRAVRPGAVRRTLKVTTTPLGLSSPATDRRHDARWCDLRVERPVVADVELPEWVRRSGRWRGEYRLDAAPLGRDRSTGRGRRWHRPPSTAPSRSSSTPTPIGEAAGCEPERAAFELTGRREEVAVPRPRWVVGRAERRTAQWRHDGRAADAFREGIRCDGPLLLDQR